MDDERAAAPLLGQPHHDTGPAYLLGDRREVLEQGVPIAHGTPGEIRSNPRVVEAYLGADAMHTGTKEGTGDA